MRIRLVLKTFVVISAIALAFGCAPQAAPTVVPTPKTTPVTIPIGVIMDQSGPVSGSAQHCLRGVIHYFRNLNEAGGIDGNTVDVLWADNKYQVPLTISAYERFKDQGAKIFILYGTPDGVAAAGLAKVDNMAIVNGARSSVFLVPPSVTFCPGAGYGNEPTAVLKWFLEGWNKSNKPTVGFILLDMGPGHAVAEGIPWMKENLKSGAGVTFNWIEPVYYPAGNTSYRTQLAKVMEQKPDLIVSFGTASMTGQLWKDAHDMGITDVVFATASPPAGGTATLKIAKSEGVEGKVFVAAYSGIEQTDIPGIQEMRKAMEKYQGYVYDDCNYQEGWAMGAIAAKAIRIAIENVGAQNVNPSDVLKAMQQITNLDIGGISAPITFAPDRRLGTDSIKLRQFKEGNLVTITDWIKCERAVPNLK